MKRLAAALALVAAVAALGTAAEAPLPAGGLLALPERDATGPDAIQNGDFGRATGDAPAGWTLRGDPGVWAIEPDGRRGPALRMSGKAGMRLVPAAEQQVTLEPGSYTLEGWVKTAGLGQAPRSGVRLCLDARPRADWWKCTPLAAGTTEWTALRAPMLAVTEPGTYRVTAGAYGLPTGTAWFDDVRLTAVGRPPLEVFLLYPNYRGLLFDDKPQVVRASVRVNGGGGERRVRLSLLTEEGGAVRLAREFPVRSPGFTAELDAASLGHGSALLRAELLDGAEVVYRYPDHRIVKLPAKVREHFAVWYDERNVTHLRGKPAFVLGIYTTSGFSNSPAGYARGHDGWGTAKIAEAPFNMLINYWLGRAPMAALDALMDDLESRGITYLQTVNFYHRDDPQYAKIEYPAAREGEDALNRWVARALSRHRALAGFYTADERPAEWVPKVFRQHRALAESAPGTVTYAVLGDGWETQAPLWRDATDVLGLDPYPITKPAGQNDLAMVGEWTRIGQDAVQHSRPVWMVIQYFPLTGAGGWPRYEDLRAMSWMAIVEGARGLFYWSFGNKGLAWVKDPAERERRWQELVRIVREIKGLESVLLAPDAPLVRAESSGGAVRWLGKRTPDGLRYLFAYNARNAPVTVTWALAEPAREAVELASSQPLAPGPDGRLTAAFGPYEVKQIRLR